MSQIKLKRSSVQGKNPTTENLELGEIAINTYDGKMFIKSQQGEVESILQFVGSSNGTVAVANGGTGQTTYTNGELLIGNTTGNTLTKATLTAGTYITITNGTGSISIAADATNIEQGTRTTTTVPITSSTGTGATLDSATSDLAGVMSSADKTKLDGIATGANNYSLPTATKSVLGGVKLGSDTVQSVAANAVTTESSRTYAIQMNASGELLVNVPWVDTNTTYTAGNGIGLSGTTFSVSNGTGLTQDANGLSLTAITAGNATIGALRYNSTTATTGQLDGGSTQPSATTRLNYGGNFHATNFDATTLYATNTSSTRSKYAVYGNSTYVIGMQSGITFGSINNDWAMTFQMNNAANRGFWWGHADHTTAQGAMALSTSGLLSIASGARIGFGTTDTTLPTANSLSVNGTIVFGTQTNKATLTYTTNTARTYTIPNVAASNFIMSEGDQTIAGVKTFSTAVAVTGTSNAAGRFYAGDTNPSNTTRLNYDGNLHVNNLNAVGDVNSASDIKFKENIQTIENALNTVLQLRGVRYKWKESQKSSIGLIAQEVEQVIPEVVSDTNDYKSVSYGNIIGLLIEAIKEQQKMINRLINNNSEDD